MAFDVFLSHDHSDFDLVDRIERILTRMKISAYMYEKYPRPGEYIPEVIKTEIRYCKYFVAFLTNAGVASQWVNQEIGIAHAYDKLIIPVNEAGVQSKGFIELREYIYYEPYTPEIMIYNLLHTLRWRLGKDHTIENGLSLDCRCGTTFEDTLPSYQEVNNAVRKKVSFVYHCPQCSGELIVLADTLEVQ